MLLMIDNYDSFTFNLVQYLAELGAEVEVRRNDTLTPDDVERMAPEHIVISPGPCTPNEAGVSMALVERFAASVPILGVCLGHQAIAQACGGRIVHAARVMHGKTSIIYHDGRGVFAGLPQAFTATRYHSLVVAPDSVPEGFVVTAWSGGPEPEIMGLRHRVWPLEGVQFHPEAILTEHGKALLRNFLSASAAPRVAHL